MALVIMVVAVTAVSWAMTAGHQHTREAQLRITASLALQQALAEAAALPYGDLSSLPSLVPGHPDNPYPVARVVEASTSLPHSAPNGVTINATEVTITILDLDGKVILSHTAVFTEPSGGP